MKPKIVLSKNFYKSLVLEKGVKRTDWMSGFKFALWIINDMIKQGILHVNRKTK